MMWTILAHMDEVVGKKQAHAGRSTDSSTLTAQL